MFYVLHDGVLIPPSERQICINDSTDQAAESEFYALILAKAMGMPSS